MTIRDVGQPDSVVVYQRAPAAVARAIGSAPALALASLIIAAGTMLVMSVADDFAEAYVDSSRHANPLTALRWESGSRLAVAGIALLLAIIAGIRYTRDLPATRYVFSDDGQEADESVEGTEPPGWVKLLVGASIVVSVVAVVLNGVDLAMTLHLHESPNFGLQG
jgi:multisubunit Na+/H+ antiporter MnhB subunit